MWTSFIGFMASGKSKVTADLLASTSRPAVSVDQMVVQKQGCSISEIFETQGQAAFRQMELNALKELDPSRNLLVDTGGGIVETAAAVSLLRSNGVVIWLDCPWEIVRARLKKASGRVRPLVNELGWEGLEDLFSRRRPLYAAAADFRLHSVGDLENLSQTAMLRSIIWQRHNEKSK